MLSPTTRLRADSIQATASTPSAIGIMASNGFHHRGRTSPILAAVKDNVAEAPAAATSSTTTPIASNTSIADNTGNNSASGACSTDSDCGALITAPPSKLSSPNTTIPKNNFVVLRRALRYIVAGLRFALVKPTRAVVMTVSKLLSALKSGHMDYEVLNSQDDVTLGASDFRHGDPSDIDDDAAPDVGQGADVPETAAHDDAAHEDVTHGDAALETAIQEAVTEEVIADESDGVTLTACDPVQLSAAIQQSIKSKGELKGQSQDEAGITEETTIQGLIADADTSFSPLHVVTESDIADSTIVDGTEPVSAQPTMADSAVTNSSTSGSSSIDPTSELATSESHFTTNFTATAEFTFRAPAPVAATQPTTTTPSGNKPYTNPPFATDSLFGGNRLDAAAFTFAAAAIDDDEKSPTIAVPTADFTFVGPAVERKPPQSAGSEESSDSWSAGSFSPLFNVPESSSGGPSATAIKVAERIKTLEDLKELQEQMKKLEELTKKKRETERIAEGLKKTVEEKKKSIEEKKKIREEKGEMEGEKKEEEKKKSGGTKNGKSNKPKKQSINKTAVWGGKKGKKAKKH
ncbi:hypothetical protein UCDDS831_g07390 [Diplodia seriata]|uniref:Uncharacterized protein n=1 Tax=Diplodia seriata TaxID=420778 RepID=A0A0G2E0V2_9PEZI|nr:hypothetical protein UCDDS831_g07390 [Diplodia seriata]